MGTDHREVQNLSSGMFSAYLIDDQTSNTKMSQLSWVGPWIYVLCGSFAKLSLLVVYLRVAPGGWFKTWSWIIVGIVLCHTIVLVFLMVFSCTPVPKRWDITIPATQGSCINVVALYFATAIANIVTDVMVMVLPIPLVLRLHMPKWQKHGVLLVFTFASLYVAIQSFEVINLTCFHYAARSSLPSYGAHIFRLYSTIMTRLGQLPKQAYGRESPSG